MAEQPKRKVRVMLKSFPDCPPCDDIRKEVRKLAKRDDLDIDLIEFKLSVKEAEDKEHPINKFFGEENSDMAPIIVVESSCKSKKLTGYSDGDIEQTIEEVRCDGESKGETNEDEE